MIIRCWGARGSIPVSGREYLKYGGSTACMEIRTKNDEIIIVDAGTGIRRLGNNLLAEDRFEYHFLFTHAHWDHILGFPFFKPLFSEKTRIRIQGCALSQGNMETLLSRTMTAPYFPVPFDLVRGQLGYENECASKLWIDSVLVESIPLSHPNMGLGYKFTEDGKSFVFLTDNELSYAHKGGATREEYAEFCKGADVLVHDAEYTPEEYGVRVGWGHSHCIEATDLAMTAGVGRFGLYHHNQDRSDFGVDAMVEECREHAEDQGSGVECFGVAEGMEFKL